MQFLIWTKQFPCHRSRHVGGGILPRGQKLSHVLPTFMCFFLFLSLAKSGMPHAHSSLSVSVPHLYYTCPEGATVKVVCNQGGVALHKTDVLKKAWLFTPHSDQRCSNQHVRHMNTGHSRGNHSLPPGLHFGASEHNFWMVLQNVTYADQGRYCCMVLDFDKDHSISQAPHSHVVLTVTPRKDTIFIWTCSNLVHDKLEVEQVNLNTPQCLSQAAK